MEDRSSLLSFEGWPALCHLADVFTRAELADVVDHKSVGARPQDPGLGQGDAGADWGEGQHPVLRIRSFHETRRVRGRGLPETAQGRCGSIQSC